jgi:DNA-binding HxlR family transcriptional regulator
VGGETSQNVATGAEKQVCPHFHAAVELIGKRWSGAILSALGEGPCRFVELNAAVPGMSDRLLSKRLRELESKGLVKRDVSPGPPTTVTYSLTEKGTDLNPALRELREWGRRWKASEAG